MSDWIKCVDQNGKLHKFPKDQLAFRPSAYGIVIEDGKILLSPQWDGFDLPGGGMDIDETITECVIREVWEETGIKVKVKETVACKSSFFVMPSTNEPVNSVLVYCLCKRVGGEISTENFDIYEKEYAKKAQWIDLERIEKLKFYNSVETVPIIQKAKQILGT